MFCVFLLGVGLVAIGVGATFGGGWATVGAVVLLALGLKILLMGLMFGFGRRAMRRRGWGPGGRHGRWPCGPGSDSMEARMDEWHQMAHAASGTDAGAADGDDVTPQ